MTKNITTAELQSKLTISKQEIIEMVVADIQEKAHDEIGRLEKLLDEAKTAQSSARDNLEKKKKELTNSLAVEKLKPYTEMGWKMLDQWSLDSSGVDARLEQADKGKMALFLDFSQEEKDAIKDALKDFKDALDAQTQLVRKVLEALNSARKDYEKLTVPGAMKSRALKSLIAKSDGGEEILDLISKIKKNFSLQALEDTTQK